MEIRNSDFKNGISHFAASTRSDDTAIAAQSSLISRSKELCSVLDSMPNMIMILNHNRQIIFGNMTLVKFAAAENCSTFMGLRPGELVFCQHALCSESGCGTSESCKSCGAVLSILEALDGENSCNECRITRKTSCGLSSMDLKVWAKPFTLDKENCCMLILSDICDEKRRRVLERIFFHDVMNIAGNISTITEMINTEMLPIDEITELLNVSANELMEEIRSQKQLLDAENNDLRPSISLISSLSIMGKVVSAFRVHEVAKDKTIRIKDNADDFIFESDVTLLFRVIGNLAKNALEASAKGDTVTLDCGTDKSACWFSCHNSSVIPEDVKLQIFQRSFSTKGADRGIGSYSVKLITEKYLGGKVSFTSDAKHGTVFRIELPVKQSRTGK